jgi:hypothetical protein
VSHGGVALLGADGTGKTTVAEQIADRLGQKNPIRVIATATQAAVPFGAFGPLLEVTEVGKPAALIRSALNSLLAQADSTLIIVDDAQLLDPLSATLRCGATGRYARRRCAGETGRDGGLCVHPGRAGAGRG